MSDSHYVNDFIIYGREEAKEIYVTGSFDNWSGKTHKLAHIPGLYWIASVPFQWGEKVTYKYIIDGTWTVEHGQPIEKDDRGLENNVFTAPSKPDEVNEQSQNTPIKSSSGYMPTSPSARSFASIGKSPQSTTSPLAATSTSSTPVSKETTSTGSANKVEDGVEGVKKVGPGVVEATPGKSTVDADTLPKPEGLSSTATAEKPSALPAVVAAPAVGSSAPAVKEASAPGTSTGSKTDSSSAAPVSSSTSSTDKGVTVPLGAAEAMQSAAHPTATSTTAHATEGQGLFSVISHVATAAAGAVSTVATDVVHRLTDETPASPTSVTSTGSELPKTATQTPATGLSTSGASQPTVPSGDVISKELNAHPKPTAQAGSATTSPKSPAAALSPLVNSDNTDKITRELASVDINKTKQEVVGAVEKLGGLVAGGLAATGAASLGGLKSVFGDDSVRDSTKGGPAVASDSTAAISAPGVPFSTTGHVGTLSGFSAATFSPASTKPANPVQQGHVGSSTATTGTTAVAPKEAAPAAVSTPIGNTANAGSSDVIKGPYTTTGKTGTTTSHKALDFTAGVAAAATAGAAAVASKTGSSSVSNGPTTTAAPGASTAAPASAKPAAPVTSNDVGPTSGISDVAASDLKSEAKKEEKNNTAGPGTASGLATPASTVGRHTGDKKGAASSLGVASGASAAGPPSTPKKGDSLAAPGSAAPSSAGGYKTAPSTPSGTPSGDRKRKSSIFTKIKSALSPSNK